MIQLFVNGQATRLPNEMSIADFLSSRGIAGGMVAVERNREWTRREEWPQIILREQDRLEVIQMMAGG